MLRPYFLRKRKRAFKPEPGLVPPLVIHWSLAQALKKVVGLNFFSKPWNSSKKIFSKQEEISPGCRKTIANTFIKSFSSSNSDLPNININQLTEITEKVRKLEENLDINLYLLKEKLDLNQQLSQKLQVWKKLKERMKNFSIKLNKILKLALMNADFFNNQVHSKLNK